MKLEKEIAKRINILLANAPSQMALAEHADVAEGTIINWTNGLGARHKTLEKFATNTRVPLDWLLHGKGEESGIIEKFRAEMAHPRPKNPAGIYSAAPGGVEARAMEMAAARLDAKGVLDLTRDILRDGSMPAEQRCSTAEILLNILARKPPPRGQWQSHSRLREEDRALNETPD